MDPLFETRPWVADLPQRMQSVLLMALRGPDQASHRDLKNVVRWLRVTVTHPDPDPGVDWTDVESNDNYMASAPITEHARIRAFLKDLEYTSIHYAMHLAHAVEIVAYEHPSQDERAVAWALYEAMVDDWHLEPEPQDKLRHRLRQRSPRDHRTSHG